MSIFSIHLFLCAPSRPLRLCGKSEVTREETEGDKWRNFGFWILNEGYGCHTYISLIRRMTAKDAKWRKGEWVIDKNPVLLCVPLRPLRLCGKSEVTREEEWGLEKNPAFLLSLSNILSDAFVNVAHRSTPGDHQTTQHLGTWGMCLKCASLVQRIRPC